MGRKSRALKKTLENTLHWCTKIYQFRRDILSEKQNEQLLAFERQLSSFRKQWGSPSFDAEACSACIEKTEGLLKVCGRPFYPVNFWSDNAEVFWVAAFVALTIRTFFCQPFRIPTCSMFPSFSGMLTQLKDDKAPTPHFFVKPFRWLLTGAENYHYTAPCDGQIRIPLFNNHEMARYNSHIRYEIENGREFGPLWTTHFLPKPYKVYLLWVGEQQVRIRVPFEFTDMEALLRKKFFPKFESFDAVLRYNTEAISYTYRTGYCLNTNAFAKQGETCLHFDILCGDMVFVDRLSYHFRRPRVGEAIVFRTKNIPNLHSDLYYIKRLAGVPGDHLSIQGTTLLNHFVPVKSSSAFRNNNKRVGIYPGYRAQGLLGTGKVHIVSDKHFFALGDNSPFSYDSRYWGEVPEKEVIGKAAFVLHPFSWRWGCAEQDKSNKQANRNDYVFR